MTTFRNLKIDWLNHAIGFLSALLGIYIAFRLENYRENQKEKEKIAIVKQALKKEIEDNLKIYKSNVDSLGSWLEYKDFFDEKWDDKQGAFVAGVNELSRMVMKHGPRFKNLREIKRIQDTLQVYDFDLVVDTAPRIGISTSSWRTALGSGILSSMDYSLTVKLSQLYDWFEKDIGTSEKEVFENFLGINKKETFADMGKLVTHYRNIARVQSLKYDQVMRIKSSINWEE